MIQWLESRTHGGGHVKHLRYSHCQDTTAHVQVRGAAGVRLMALSDWSAGLYDGVRHETGYCPGPSPLYWAGHLAGRLRDYGRRVSIAVRYGAWVRHSELYGRSVQAPAEPAWAYRLGYFLQRFERRHERRVV